MVKNTSIPKTLSPALPPNGEEDKEISGELSPSPLGGRDLGRGSLPPILQVGDVLLSPDIITEYFACDIAKCGGRCCEEGDAGAPVTLDEIADIEEQLDDLWPRLSASAQSEIDRTGVAYADPEGELVTCIVNNRDCAFRGSQGCLLRQRPISCHLYPIREKRFGGNAVSPSGSAEASLVGLNYHRWEICKDAVEKGRREGIRLYQFLREPLIRRFGDAWYAELELMVEELRQQGILA